MLKLTRNEQSVSVEILENIKKKVQEFLIIIIILSKLLHSLRINLRISYVRNTFQSNLKKVTRTKIFQDLS